MEELIANRYVNALVEVTSAEQRVAFSEVLSTIAGLFDDANVSEMLSSPLVSKDQKTAFVVDGLGEGSDKSLQNFIKIIGENGRLDLLPTIARRLNQAIQKEKNEYEGVVTSSNTLSDAELADLQTSLKTYTGSIINLTQEQSDLDGIKVSVDDLGIEVNFSKQRVKEQLIDFITKSL
ncbi:F0F1 ATP synthase subunit delta [bacterium]|nr:F0F1 ATP synthase subunit delta [bacterium]MBU1957928.1 F0F1 ATP synthase subunit delta [bacterium]